MFTLGVLDVFVMGMIYDKSSSLSRGDDIGITTRFSQSNIEAVRYGLRGWRNFPDQNGHDIPFKTVKRHTNGRTYHVVVDECLERLGIQDIASSARRSAGLSNRRVRSRFHSARAEEVQNACGFGSP